MTPLPLRDDAGNVLLRVVADGAGSQRSDASVPCPLALVVVELDGRILMGLNRWRGTWELPGGMIEAGESPGEAALRELAEETGVALDSVELTGYASFVLAPDQRREDAAVFSRTLLEPVEPVPSDELVELMWWDPAGEELPDMSPLDAEIACRCRPRP